MTEKLAVLMQEIAMPGEAAREVLALLPQLDLKKLSPHMEGLFAEETWTESLANLRQILGEDARGMKMLTCELICALKTWDRYQALGISRKVYLDTIDCFPRFVKEHMASFGTYGFDREWWTVHQLSCLLFRLAPLEFELRKDDVALHIPTGSDLDPAVVDASLAAIEETIAAYFPRWKNLPRTCHSWLLSPTMAELLPPDSRILQFARRFAVTLTGENNDDYLQWCYKRKDIPTQDLPEETSLQRNLKAKLLKGEPFLDARGVLIK